MLPKCHLCVLFGLEQPRTNLGHFHDLSVLEDRVIRVEATPEGPKYSAIPESSMHIDQNYSGNNVDLGFLAESGAEGKVLPVEMAVGSGKSEGHIAQETGGRCGRYRKRPAWWKDYEF